MNHVIITKPDITFEDGRGSIKDILNTTEPIHHIGMITFTKGAVRANHYHNESHQYDYVVEGKIELAVKDSANPEGEVEKFIIEKGNVTSIPKGIIHAYKALEPSVMLDITTISRAENGYEDDTIRVDSLFS